MRKTLVLMVAAAVAITALLQDASACRRHRHRRCKRCCCYVVRPCGPVQAQPAQAPPAAPQAPGAPAPYVGSLEGRTARGRLGAGAGATAFSADFRANGGAYLWTAEDNRWVAGTWSQSGSQVSMTAGHSTFSGTLQGGRLSGTRTRRGHPSLPDVTDSWYLDVQR